jgi:ATP-dependent helicase/nuclease subunit B
MSSQTLFLGWGKPLATLVADWLWAQPERLRHRLVVVPTRESGRRLRELLLEQAAQVGAGALLGPRLATPDDFFRPTTGMPDSVCWAGWVQVLRKTPDSAVADLFPAGIAHKDDGWRRGVAQQIEQARELLLSGNATFELLASKLPEESARWSELAALERQVIAQWAKWGFKDPAAEKRSRAQNPQRPPGVEEIVIAGVADPTWLSIEAWQRLAGQGLQCTVLVGAPEKLREAFDAWGVPKPGFWSDRNQAVTPQPTTSRVAADALGVAEVVVRACVGKSNHEVAIGVCDSSFEPAIARRFQTAGWATFDPQGVPLAKDGWPELLEALAGALEAPEAHAAVARLARHPKIWRERLAKHSARAVFAALEKWERKHAASDAALVIEKLSRAEASEEEKAAGQLLQQVCGLIKEFSTGKDELFEARLLKWFEADAPDLTDAVAGEMAGWSCLESNTFQRPLRLRWLATTLSGLCQNPEVSEAVLALQGWLELPYDPAPHLVLAGLHEGSVPETPAVNPLITEVVREKFGLRDRKARLAREVFLYTAMVEGRRAGGSVTVVTAQIDPAGEPCKPSRVLLQTSLAELPQRVLALVREKPDEPLQPTPPWSRGDWQLRLLAEAKRNKPWEHLSPSTLKAYLDCPTRFYFNRVLGWDKFEPFKHELDGAGFGDLLHAVLFRWGSDKEARDFTDPEKLKVCWLDLLQQHVEEQFGKKLPPLLALQVMSAQERLTALAPEQARQCQEGWHILELEKEYTDVLKLAGVPLVTRVDRIDRHEDGRVRVIDYKTAKDITNPHKTHLRTWSESRPKPLGPLLTLKGKQYGWLDLQMPIYARTVQQALKLESTPEVCYVVLPEAVSETGFEEFKGLNEVVDNAMQWAEAAAQGIVEGVFWAPAPEVKYDLFGAIAPEGLQKALGKEWAEFLGRKQQSEGSVP